MPIRDDPLDPRVYGLAPVTSDAHGDDVLWTILGVMQYLGIKSETTIRANAALMALKVVVSPGIVRWRPSDIKQYVLDKQAKQTLSKGLRDHMANTGIVKAWDDNRTRTWKRWQAQANRQLKRAQHDPE